MENLKNILIDGERIEEFDSEPTQNINPQFTDKGLRNIVQPTELGEALTQLNNDKLDPKTNMSGIDMRANLHPYDIPPLHIIDSLVTLSFFPQELLSFTRQKKRLSVSKRGKGRDDIVNVSSGKQTLDADKAGGIRGFLSKFGNRGESNE